MSGDFMHPHKRLAVLGNSDSEMKRSEGCATINIVEPFWMVMPDLSSDTTYPHRHDSLQSARDKADSLALKNRGVKFFVLECVGAAIATRDPVEWIEPLRTLDDDRRAL